MYLLALGLLIISSWYLLNLYKNFNNDTEAKKEIDEAWKAAKEGAQGKNPFAPGKIKEALNSYKNDMMNKP